MNRMYKCSLCYSLLLLLLLRLQRSSTFPFAHKKLTKSVDSATTACRIPYQTILQQPQIKLIQYTQRYSNNSNDNNYKDNRNSFELQRRTIWKKSTVQFASILTVGTALAMVWPRSTQARSTISNIDGKVYTVTKSSLEWQSQLSPMQYYILREGGTEPPGYSVLEMEKRSGQYICAGCGTPLFAASSKFTSGTGWPSFARKLNGVDIVQQNFLTNVLLGTEVRCTTCGGHLGDVFQDGYLFLGTEAAITGQRFCIDGAALVFVPDSDDAKNTVADAIPIRGDIPQKKQPPTWTGFLQPPTIISRNKTDE